jgi:hypothetical protein
MNLCLHILQEILKPDSYLLLLPLLKCGVLIRDVAEPCLTDLLCVTLCQLRSLCSVCDRVICECWCIWKDVDGSGRGLFYVLYLDLSGRTKENIKHLSQDSWCPEWILKTGPLEHEVGVLTTAKRPVGLCPASICTVTVHQIAMKAPVLRPGFAWINCTEIMGLLIYLLLIYSR